MEKLKNWKYYSLFRNILKFEIFYKACVLIILSPLLRNAFHYYLDQFSYGIAFNLDMIYEFMTWQGVLLIIMNFIIVTLVIYYEINVLIEIVAMEYKQIDYSLRKLMLMCFRHLKHIDWKTFALCGIYLIFLLPLVHVGYLNSYVTRWDIPHFVFGELKLTIPGQILICFIYVFYYSFFILMLLTPFYMVLKSQNIIQASKSSVHLIQKMSMKDKLTLGVVIGGWIICEYILWKIVPYAMLHNRDFNIYFFKYLINSTSFRLSALQYIFVYLLQLIAMIGFLHYLIILLYRYDEGFITIDELSISTEKLNEKVIWFQTNIKNIVMKIKIFCLENSFYQNHQKTVKMICMIIAFCVLFAYLQQNPAVHHPWVIGHRGSGYAVENTYDAIKNAAQYHANWAEIDIQLSKDGIPIVFHDASLSRLAHRNEAIGDLTYSQLKTITLKQNGQQASIISLQDMIQQIKKDDLDIGLLIELKVSQGNGEEMAEKIIDIIEEEKFESQAIYMSLDYDSVQFLKKEKPQWWVGYCIYGSVGDIDSSIWHMNIDFLAIEENRASNAFIQKAVSHMLPIYIWTVDNVKSMKQYLQMGVSGLITNYPDLGRQVIDDYENEKTRYYYYDGKGYPRQTRFEVNGS